MNIKLSELRGNIFEMSAEDTIDKNRVYTITFPKEDYLIVVAGTEVGTAGVNFEHKNVLAKRNRVHEFKHYRAAGSKFWTSKAGVDFYFAIPKGKIELIAERCYSYVKILIGGQKYTLSVSGGTGKEGWVDWVNQFCSICAGHNLKSLKVLAENALSVEECRAKGILFDLPKMRDDEIQRFKRLVTEKEIWGNLKAGQKVSLITGCSFFGEEIVEVIERPSSSKRMYLCCDIANGQKVRVRFTQIDWLKTAELNKIEVEIPEEYNRLGKFVEEIVK